MNTNPNDTQNAQSDAQPPPAKYPPPPPSISGRSTASFNPNIAPPMPQPAFMPPAHIDWWNPYQFNQPPHDDLNKKNANAKQMNSQYMDPAYMYYMMAAAAAAYPTPFGYPPAYGAYAYPPINQMNPMAHMNQSRYYQDDDQRSIKSFVELDARSDRHADHMKLKESPAAGLLMPEHKISEELAEVGRDMQHLGQSQLDKQQEAVMMMRENEKANRMTPLLHQLAHVRCSFSFNGVIRVRANDPCDGQPALVDVFNLADFMESYLCEVKKSADEQQRQQEQEEETQNEREYKHELDDFGYMNEEVRNQILSDYKLVQEFPGPLSKELNTSKAHVIQFCLKNVKECLWSNTSLIDAQSHALLWDFLALLVRQNGLVDLKTDISPLLLSGLVDSSESSLRSCESSQALSQAQDFVMVKQRDEDVASGKEEEANLNRLRQLLGAGQKTEAVDYTIKHNMWSHAFFLASSTFNSLSQTQSLAESKPVLVNSNAESKILTKVKLRFINSLCQNDPIVTCYQLLMGRVPTAASSLSKWEWNEWRRHLAMIVSNVDETNQHLVLNTIKTMGDSLASNGRTAASHFCYLLSNCSFGTYEKKSSKLVLIGSSHNQEFSKFCQIGAIQATEIFEFAQSLLNSATTTTTSSTFNSDNFLKYKLIYANKLVEHGLMHEAYKYTEIIANTINNNVSKHTDKLASVFHLANRLKIYHPDYFNPEESESEWQQPLFLTQLNQHYSNHYSKNIAHLVTCPPEQRERPECKIEAKCEQVSFVEPLNYQPQDPVAYQPTEHIVHEPTAAQNVAYDQNTYQDYSNYSNYSNYPNYNQQTPLATEEPPSRKSSIHSLGHQAPAYLPNEQAQHQFNYQAYYPTGQPAVYNQTTTRSRTSSTSTENNLVAAQAYDPNYYQAIFTPKANIAEEPERVSEERQAREVAREVVSEREAPSEEEEMRADASSKAEESKKASLWDWFKKPAGPKKMILPDDRKKTIVWDDKLKKYVNKENGSSAASSESVKPPPISVPSQASATGATGAATADSTTNKFSLRNTNTKRPSNYYARLDIMADKSKKSEAQVLAPIASNMPPPSQLPPRFFVPDTTNASMQPQQHQHQEPVPQQALYFNPALDSQQ